jgi:hypothetical protein
MSTDQGLAQPSGGTVSRRNPSYLLVLYSGLATSALALLGVHLLDVYTTDFNIMGWYADYLIPVGAVLVGVAASSGYGLASWLTGVKISHSLLWAVMLIQLLVYFAAQYIEFSHLHLIHRSNGRPVGFFEYYDLMARSFAWKHEHDGGSGQPLGIYGYFFRFLEIAGFVGGGLIVPALLRKAPYCQACRRYMQTRALGTIAASVPAKKFKKSDTAGSTAHQTEQQQAFDRGKRIAEILQSMSTEGRSAEFQQTLAELAPAKKQAVRLPRRITVHLIACKQCRSGGLLLKLVSGHGKQIKTVPMAQNDLAPDFVRSIQS